MYLLGSSISSINNFNTKGFLLQFNYADQKHSISNQLEGCITCTYNIYYIKSISVFPKSLYQSPRLIGWNNRNFPFLDPWVLSMRQTKNTDDILPTFLSHISHFCTYLTPHSVIYFDLSTLLFLLFSLNFPASSRLPSLSSF